MKKITSGVEPPVLGEAVNFWPTDFVIPAGTRPVLTGHIVYINTEHRYYTVEFSLFDYVLRESFKFEEGVGYDADLVHRADHQSGKRRRR